MLLLLTQMVFFQDRNVFLQICQIVLFGAKPAFLHIENHHVWAVFLSETTKSQKESMCYISQLLTHMVFFGENHVFFTSGENSNLGQTKPISTLKQLSAEIFLSKTN
jgi:hypothetical protein